MNLLILKFYYLLRYLCNTSIYKHWVIFPCTNSTILGEMKTKLLCIKTFLNNLHSLTVCSVHKRVNQQIRLKVKTWYSLIQKDTKDCRVFCFVFLLWVFFFVCACVVFCCCCCLLVLFLFDQHVAMWVAEDHTILFQDMQFLPHHHSTHK